MINWINSDILIWHREKLGLSFNEVNIISEKLAEISDTAHKKAAKYLEDNPPQKELTATRLGRLRLDIKKHLSAEMMEIDKLVKKVVG